MLENVMGMMISKHISSLIDPKLESKTKRLIKVFAEKAILLDTLGSKYKDYCNSTSRLLYPYHSFTFIPY